MNEARIIPWAEVEQGDEALFDGMLAVIEAVQQAESVGVLGMVYPVTRVAWRREDGTVFVGDFDPDQLTAVVRPGLTETEWGVLNHGEAGAVPYGGEEAARWVVSIGGAGLMEVVARQVTPWAPAPEKEEGSA